MTKIASTHPRETAVEKKILPDPSRVRLLGPFTRFPSQIDGTKVHKVVTIPWGSIFLMLFASESAIYTMESGPTAISCAVCAAASSEVTPAGVIFRMRLLPVSAM